MAVDSSGNVFLSYYLTNSIQEIPRAFVSPTSKFENAMNGTDILPIVLPATENLFGLFAPNSSQPWLNITGATNGVVSFTFTDNTTTSNRTAKITVLGITNTITQLAPVAPPSLIKTTVLGKNAFQFAFSNNITGASFSVWSTTNLSFPFSNWTLVGFPTNTSPGLFQFASQITTNDAQKYYRVSSP